MSLAESLAAAELAVALEITPPKSSLPSVLSRRARLLGDAACAINLIQRPGRQTSLEAAIELKAAGLEPVWHLVTRGKSRATLDRELAAARAAGITDILCIRGDHETVGEDEVTVRGACAAAAAVPGALVGATLNQYVPDREAVLRNLLPKLRAGASYVQTQPVFHLEGLRPLAETLLEESPATRVVAMAMPLTSLDAATRIETRLGISLPAGLMRRLAAGDEAAAWSAFEDTLASLVASPVIAGVALMTSEMDPPPDTAARILQALHASGAIERLVAGG